MEIKNYIMTVDNFLPYESLSSLIQWANKKNNKFEKAEIFLNNQKSELREDIRKVDNFGLRGINKEEVKLENGMLFLLDTHSPHQLFSYDKSAMIYFACSMDSKVLTSKTIAKEKLLNYAKNNSILNDTDRISK